MLVEQRSNVRTFWSFMVDNQLSLLAFHLSLRSGGKEGRGE